VPEPKSKKVRKERFPVPPLTEEQLEQFKQVVLTILQIDDEHMRLEDYDGSTALLGQLYSSIESDEDFERFVQIIASAGDADFRSPK
jgi:hypothetical protein